jgi:hypothetical protein
MRDILFTIASAGSRPAPLNIRVGAWETFVDTDSGVTVQFARARGRVIARVLEPRAERIDATLVVGSGTLDLLATLRHAADAGASPRPSS